jgi:uncharacterized membrane protein YeiB
MIVTISSDETAFIVNVYVKMIRTIVFSICFGLGIKFLMNRRFKEEKNKVIKEEFYLFSFFYFYSFSNIKRRAIRAGIC